MDLQGEVLARLESILEKRARSRRRRQDWELIRRYVASAEEWAERYEVLAKGASSGFVAERAAALRAEVERVDRAERQGKSAAQMLKMLGHEERARSALVAHLRDPDDADKKAIAWRALHSFCGPVNIEAEVQIDREHRARHSDANGGSVNRAKRIIRRLKARPHSWVGPEADF